MLLALVYQMIPFTRFCLKIWASKKSDKWAPKILSQNVALVGDWFAADIIQRPKNLRCPLDLMRTDIFLFPNVKEALAGHILTNNSLTTAWVGVTDIITKEVNAAAYRKWYDRCL